MLQVEEAIKCLLEEDIVAFPTDTVYGVAAVASSMKAIEKIYEIKERDRVKPLIAMVPEGFNIGELVEIPQNFKSEVESLIQRYWPGELTLIFKMKKNPYIVVEYETLGIRIPNHPIALEIINGVGRPIFVTSANRSGEPAGITADEVERSIGDNLGVLCIGECGSGVASTIVSYIQDEKKIIREGNIKV